MKRRGGFTLLEVVLVVGLLGSISLAVIGFFLASGVSSQFGLTRARAAYVAETEMTRLKLAGYPTLVSYVGSPPAPINLSDGPQTYQEQVSVTRLNSTVGTAEYDLLRVTLLLTWSENKSFEVQSDRALTAATQSTYQMNSVVAQEAQY